MKLIDLSQPIFDGCPHCPVHPDVTSRPVATHAADGWLVEHLSLSNHTGSHVDVPLHKIVGGASLDEVPLEAFVGPAHLADLRHLPPSAPIGPAELAATLPGPLTRAIALLVTGWGQRRALTDEWLHCSPHLTPAGAQWIVESGARAVGIDHYSIGGSREPSNADTHQILLGAGLWIVEELRVPPDAFDLPQPIEFWALPINLRGHSGAFCRPVLRIP